MARSISSASARRARSVSVSSRRSALAIMTVGSWPYSALPPPGGDEIESEQHAVAVRHVADDPPHRQGELLDEGRCGDDLLAFREDRLLVDVDDFQIVPPLEVLVADGPQVVDGAGRSGGHARDVQSKDVALDRKSVV